MNYNKSLPSNKKRILKPGPVIIISLIPLISAAFVTSAMERINPVTNHFAAVKKSYQQEPINIGSGGSPSIAVDENGTVHFCYLSEGAEGKVIYATLYEGNIEKETIDNDVNNFSPAITIDKKGSLHIAYGAGEFGDMQLLYLKKTGANWSDLQIVENNILYETSNICIKTDKNDSIHISYLNSRMGGQLCYLKKNGVWSKEILKYGLHYCISFDLDTNGHAHFSYYYPFIKKAALENPGLNYLTNSPNGNWQNYEAPDADWMGRLFQAPLTDISVDRMNRPHISYVGQENFSGTEDYKYVVKTDTGWTEFFIETGTPSGGPNAIAADPLGNPHIIYLRTDDQKLKYATYFNGEWKKQDIDYNVDYPENQKLIDMYVDNHGNVHIVYVKNEVIYSCLNPLPLSAAKIKVDPQELVYGTVELGEDSTQTLYIKNEGVLDLYISDIILSGGDSAEFSLLHLCDTINPEDSCEVLVTFTPQFMGEKQTTLEIVSNDPDAPLTHVSITGRTPYPVINPDPDDLIFDPVEIGGIDSLILKTNNAGDADLVIDSISLTDLASTEFSFRSFCSVVHPSENCEVRIYYSPESPGTDTASLFIFSNDPESPKIRVFIKARPPSGCMDIEIENNLLDFGVVPIGKISSKKLKISNTGERELLISSREISGRNFSSFKTSNACTSIDPGDSCNIDIIFHPETVGTKAALLTFTSNDPDQPEFIIALSGTGTEVQDFSLLFSNENDIKFFCIDTLSSGDFILGGMIGDNAYLVSLSPLGNIIWQKEFLPPVNGSYYVGAARETWDKGLIVGGNGWIVRLNSEGEIIWQKQIDNRPIGPFINDIKVTSDSCFIATGSMQPFVLGHPYIWIGKLDSAGIVLWQKIIGKTESNQIGYSVLEADYGNFIVAGAVGLYSFITNVQSLQKNSEHGYLYAGGPAFLSKFSSDGDMTWQGYVDANNWMAHIWSDNSIMWQKSYSPPAPADISITKSGDIIAAGSRKMSSYISDVWAMRLTKTGSPIWQKIMDLPGPQESFKVQSHSTGSIAIAGYYDDADAEIDRGWVILLSPEGMLEGCNPDFTYNGDTSYTPATISFEDLNLSASSPLDNFVDGSIVSSEGNGIVQVFCNGIPTDMDYDGVPNNEEYGSSGRDIDYDGNNDGLPDAWQSNAASFHTFDSLAYVTLAASSETKLSEVAAVDNPSPDDQPEEFEFPAGFFDFSVTGLEIGGSASLNLYLPEGMAPVTYYKYSVTHDNPDTSWYEFLYDGETGAEIGLNQVVLHFKDGSRGDEDLEENGIIKDIGGPGSQKSTGKYDKPYPAGSNIMIIYPNPFKTSARIVYELDQTVQVQIDIYNFLGQKIKTLSNEQMEPGYHEVIFHSESLPGGMYFLHIHAGEYQETQKLLLIK